MLTGDVSEIGGFRLFRSQDFGMTFVPTDLPFEPLIQMLYNPGDCNVLVTLSITVDQTKYHILERLELLFQADKFSIRLS